MTSIFNTRRAFVVVVALGLFAMAARTVSDSDVWWHLKTGQLILQNHAVFHADPYSSTKAGEPWINHEWLSDILMFAVYRLAGWAGLIVTFAVVTSATFLLVLWRCAGGPYIASAFAVWGALASAPSWEFGLRLFLYFSPACCCSFWSDPIYAPICGGGFLR